MPLFLAELLNKIQTFLLRKQTCFKKTDLFQENRPFSWKQTSLHENRRICTLVSCCINFFTNSLDFIILTFYFGDLMPLSFLSFKDITLDFATSTRGRFTEYVQKYVLVFRHLGLITSCPRWVLVFHEKIGKQIMSWYCTTRLPSEHKEALVVALSLLVYLYIFTWMLS